MSKRLPYEDNLSKTWTELPLPNEDKAWEDMKRRLDKDDDSTGIVWWRRGCILWGLLIGLGVLIAWWFLDPPQWLSGRQKNSNLSGQMVDSVSNRDKTTAGKNQADFGSREDSSIYQDHIPNHHSEPEGSNPSIKGENEIPEDLDSALELRRDQIEDPITGEKQNQVNGKNVSRKRTATIQSLKKYSQPKVTENLTGNPPASLPLDKPQTSIDSALRQSKPIPDSSYVPIPDSLNVKNLPTISPSIDSVLTTKQIDSAKAESIVKTQPLPGQDSTKKKKKHPVFLSAGVAVHQQLPVAGQKFTPYNSLGRKGTFRDYIPALYLRINKQGKWFVQSEFRYGAPQYTKDILYNQLEQRDTIGGNNITITTSNTLKKTYYHQLPVTFNYYLLPNWSVGTGLSWNKFSNAISGLDVVKSDNNTSIDSVITKTIVSDKNDSVFKKSYFQAIIESHYQFKRWSVGARYSFGLQPYLDFRIAGGTQKERNSSLQIFLRYEFWQEKKK